MDQKSALVIDDEPQAQEFVAKILRQRGFVVTPVASAEEGLSQLRAHSFDLVVIDWILPGLDGVAFTRAMRALPNGSESWVLALTARTKESDVMAMLDAGADDFIPKPADATTVTTRIVIAERALASQKRAETARTEWMRCIEAMPVGIAFLDGGRVSLANSTLARLLQFESLDALALEPAERLFPPATLEFLRTATSDQTKDLAFYSRVGEEITLETCVFTTLTFGDKPERAFIVRDTREIKRLQTQLNLADRLSSIGTLAAGIGHEINNPLTYVIANLAFLDEALAPHNYVEPEVRAALDEARDGAHRVSAIVRDLRLFSRHSDSVTAGGVDLARLATSSANLVGHGARDRARIEIDIRSRPLVTGSEGRIGQALVNMLVNATQAIAPGSPDANEISVVVDVRDGLAVLEVHDTGCGIPEDVLPKIFEAFFTTKDTGEGCGLGLAISHNIITELGGKLLVTSTVGKGSIFTALLPLAPASALPTESGKSILVIDDEPFVVQGFRRALRGWRITTVTSGDAALKALSEDASYDVVLCDILMPQMNGIELYSAIKQQMPAVAERFVFMTGASQNAFVREFLRQGDHTYVEKPVATDKLREVLERKRSAGGGGGLSRNARNA